MRRNGHGGNLRELAVQAGRTPEEILDFSANINPLGPPEWLRPLVGATLSSVVHYPDPDASALVQAAAKRYGVSTEEVVAGNGTSEILYLLARVPGASRAVIPEPAYVDYAAAARSAGLFVRSVPMKEEDGFALDIPALAAVLEGKDLVFIGRPNNPTGLVCDAEEVRSLALSHPSTTFVVDEAFADFVDGMDRLTGNRPPNVIVLLSLTKIFAIPGLRLGCAVGNPDRIGRIRALQPPWSVNAIAQAVGVAALKDGEYMVRSREYVGQQRERLMAGLRSIPGLFVFPGRANFLLVRIDRPATDAAALAGRLLSDGIAIRTCDDFGGLAGRYFRVAVRTEEENDRLCEALRDALGLPLKTLLRRRTPALMVQGTSSGAGKSVLTAALCRILLQDGYRVAPFKAQNMSLNSFVTADGGEMGRAQVLQAQACRIAPDVRMNPVLLKPNSDTGAQVIVRGKPVGNMDVDRYSQYKAEAFGRVQAAYDDLAREHDVIVLEGAGSPAEINLKAHDIVNMRMARYAGANVLLVGDIDRGGVFASFIGTMETLTEEERARIGGYVVNRFRGKEALLEDALEYMQRYTGRPVLGVVPYLHGLGLPEEDSVAFKAAAGDGTPLPAGMVDIVVLDLPHISNFTDVDSLRGEPDVRVRIVRSAEELGRPDAVILPGSRNVIGDLEHLRREGLDRAIIALAAGGETEVVGICGGFQMMGETISDLDGVESGRASVPGLGLLSVSTEMRREKVLARTKGRHLASGEEVAGYEIHHGRTPAMGVVPVVVLEDGRSEGATLGDGRMWGTYLHGIFDADGFRRWFVDRLRQRRGLPPAGKVLARYDLEPALDRLADVVRRSLRMEEIYRLAGLR